MSIEFYLFVLSKQGSFITISEHTISGVRPYLHMVDSDFGVTKW